MIAIGTPGYYALPPKERFDVAIDNYVDYTSKPDHLSHKARAVEEEIYALRLECSIGPPGRPDLADPVWDILHNTFIRSAGLGGGITLWGPSKSQVEDLVHVFDADRRDGVPGRYIIEKTRRVGGSLTSGRWAMTRVCRREGQKLLAMAHDAPTAEEMFQDIYTTTFENDPLRPDAKYANKRELFFDLLGSKVRVMPVVGGEGKGAGSGWHYVLMHEFLRYEEYGVDFADLVTNLLQTMPEMVETFFCLESSGRGDGGVAYEMCQSAYHDPTNGVMGKLPDGGWRNIFLPSFKRWDAERPFANDNERQDLVESLKEPEHADEKHYVEELKVSLEHINWRRHHENSFVGRNKKHKKALIRQEAPMTFMDCFQSKGASEFDADRIRELMLTKDVSDGPKWIGELEVGPEHGSLYDAAKFKLAYATPLPTFRETDEGEMFVWAKPFNESHRLAYGMPLHRYCMGVDIAEGAEEEEENDNAFSVSLVHDRDTKELVCAYRGKAQHDQLVKIVRLQSKWYNDAIINNETNRFRKWTEDLASTDRGRSGGMYVRRQSRDSIGHDDIDTLGWLTTPSSKDDLVEAGHHILHNVPQWLRWKVILEEYRTFKRESKAKRKGKRKGIHDDTFIASTLSWYCDRDMPKMGVSPLAAEASDKRTLFEKQRDQFLKEQKQLSANLRSLTKKGPSRRTVMKGQF